MPEDDAAKTRLHRAIVADLGELGTGSDDVFVIPDEPPIENGAVRGVPGAEWEIRFPVDVQGARASVSARTCARRAPNASSHDVR